MAWILLGVGVGVWVNWFYPNLIGKGRILSRPFYRIFGRPPWTRATQTFLWMIEIAINGFVHFLPVAVNIPASYVLYCAWYLDDYFTGDDDKWKKFWDLVRNKIKWKMDLPVTSHAR